MTQRIRKRELHSNYFEDIKGRETQFYDIKNVSNGLRFEDQVLKDNASTVERQLSELQLSEHFSYPNPLADQIKFNKFINDASLS